MGLAVYPSNCDWSGCFKYHSDLPDYLSELQDRGFGRGNIFVGVENYVKVFGDSEVWQSLINTFKYAIVEVPFSIAIALVLAVLLNRK